MSEQHYATPNADLQPESNATNLLTPLLATKPWARFCSIMGFLGAALMVLGGLGIMLGGAAVNQAMPYGSMLGAAYIFIAALYIPPSVFLFKYASAIAVAHISNRMQDIAVALTYQKSFWKFAGIMMILMLVFFVLGIVAAIVIPMMAMM